MDIIPIQLADFDLVEVKTTPHCKKHGAMNKITKEEDGGGFWRCITVSGYKSVEKGNSKGKIHVETICRAGCLEIRK